jgi:serine/threonine-protein kinase HipA
MNDVRQVEVFLHGLVVGRIAMTPDRVCAFQYDPLYLQSGQSISPFHLPLSSELFISRLMPFDGNFGVFDDSLPDGWGQLLLDRRMRSKGIAPNELTVLQLLCFVGNTGRGALEYRPDLSNADDMAAEEMPQFDFEAYREESKKLLEQSSYAGEDIETMYRYGGSSGGARPKAFIEDEDGAWLVKFSNSSDPEDIGKVEYEYSLLAKACGIEMPDTKLFEGKYFATKRYDREAHGKIHTVSAAGLLHADYRIPSLDYTSLLLACQKLTRNMKEVERLYRQMVFNVVISNRDDHAKNFSFQLVDTKWKLAPAYDILPSAGFGGQHTTAVNESGNPKTEDLLAVATAVGLNKSIAQSTIDAVVSECKNARMARYDI